MEERALLNIYRAFNSNKTLNTHFLLNTHEIFSMMEHKTYIHKAKGIEIVSTIISDHKALKIEVKYKLKWRNNSKHLLNSITQMAHC